MASLLTAWTVTQLHAQSKPEWKRAYEIQERSAAKSIALTNQILIAELEEQQRSARQAGDKAQEAQLEAKRALAQTRQGVLTTGVLWHPGRQEAAVEAFCQEAAGRKWSLEGTRSVGQFQLLARDIVCIGRTGTESRQRNGTPLLPGVFVTGRQDGGATVYMVSPDLQHALCLIVPRVYDGQSPQWQLEVLKSTISAPAPATHLPRETDLLTLLTNDVHQKLHQSERKLFHFLETHLNDAIKQKQMQEVSELIRPLATHRRALTYYKVSPISPPATREAFIKKATGTMWIMSRLKESPRFLYTGEKVVTLDSTNKELGSQPAEVIWPGLLRMTAPSGQTSYLAVSPDLRDAQYLPATSIFHGKLAE